MSERTYEDGTPAAYEPRVEDWIEMAADTASTVLLGKNPTLGNVRNAIRLGVARHAPKPEDQPIRRGDVVQVILTKSCRVVVCDAPADGQPGEFRLSNGQLYSPKDVARIGRARYYPDGTTVED